MPTESVFVNRVMVQNYKSIKFCDVTLQSMTVLVGPNGSGKSNFMDAFRFASDALSSTLDHALRDRGGIGEVRRRSGGHPNNFSLRFNFVLPDSSTGHFAFKVSAVQDGGFRVADEECVVRSIEFGSEAQFYRVQHGSIKTNVKVALPVPTDDRLFLVAASSVPEFRSVFDSFVRIGLYNLNPLAIRSLQVPDAGNLLRRDGSNLASVLAQIEKKHPKVTQRIMEYLMRISPGVENVTRKSVGNMETLEFRQQVEGQKSSWRFPASSMSDGTLRGLGVLVALLQANGLSPSIVGIEEPEVALHPAALGVLIDAIRDAATTRQVLVTSHSPDLLDRNDIDDRSILAVESERGVTSIGQLGAGVRESLREKLFTPGELLRMNQLAPSEDATEHSEQQQLSFFEM